MKQTGAVLTQKHYQNLAALLADGARRRIRNFAIVIGIALIGGLVVWLITGAWNEGLAFVVAELLLVSFVPHINRRFGLSYAQADAIRYLADKLGGTYVAFRHLRRRTKTPLYDGLGWFKREENCIDAVINGVKVEHFTYTYRHPFENRYDRKKLRVTALRFEKSMPHVLIRSKDSGIMGKLDEHVAATDRLHVESQFEKQFTVYTHRRTASDALAILAPNFLATVMDYGKDFDTELLDNTVYVYSDADELDSSQLRAELVYITKLIALLERKLGKYKLVLPGEKYPYMTSTSGAGTARVGEGQMSGAIFFIVFYNISAAVQLAIQWNRYGPFGRAVMGGLIIGSNILLWYFMVFRKRRRT